METISLGHSTVRGSHRIDGDTGEMRTSDDLSDNGLVEKQSELITPRRNQNVSPLKTTAVEHVLAPYGVPGSVSDN